MEHLLTNIFPEKCNFKLYFGNYFTGLPLLSKLKERGIISLGTIRKNRDGKCPLLSDIDLKQGGHGSMDEMRDKNGDIIVKWFDNSIVELASSFVGKNTIGEMKRCDKSLKEHINATCPQIVKAIMPIWETLVRWTF